MNATPKPWKEQGCPACRLAWESGTAEHGLRLVGTSNDLHARLYQCSACFVFWEELGRHAHETSPMEAVALKQARSFIPGNV